MKKRRKPWYVRATIKFSNDGKQIRKSISIFATKREDQEYLVKGDTTVQLSYSTFKPRFQKLLKDLKIEPHTIYDTRHTFATLLNNANANQSRSEERRVGKEC